MESGPGDFVQGNLDPRAADRPTVALAAAGALIVFGGDFLIFIRHLIAERQLAFAGGAVRSGQPSKPAHDRLRHERLLRDFALIPT